MQPRTYEDARSQGLWRPRWTEVAEDNANLARLAILAVQNSASPAQTEPKKSERDDRVIQSSVQVNLKTIDVEIIAEACAAEDFEKSPRLRVIEELADIPGTPLVVRLTPSPVCPPVPEDLSYLDFVRQYGILVSPRELDRIVDHKVDLATLIAQKLYRGFAQRRPLRDYEVDELLLTKLETEPATTYLQPTNEILDKIPLNEAWILHPKRDSILNNLTDGTDVLIVGPSSSGKSTLILQVAEALHGGQAAAFYVNFGDTPTIGPEVAEDILFGLRPRTTILVDDLQSYPSGAELILGTLALRKGIRPHQARSLSVCAATWREYSNRAKDLSPGIHTTSISPRQLTAQIARRFGGALTAEQRRQLADEYGDDLNLLRLALQASDASSLAQTEGAVTNHVTDPFSIAHKYIANASDMCSLETGRVERAILVLSALGSYDIAISKKYLARAAALDDTDVDSLLSVGIGKVQENFIRLGHRSLCSLLAKCLAQQGAWARCRDVGGVASAESAVTGYLESLSTNQALAALRAICARTKFRDAGSLDARAQHIVEIWSSFNTLTDRLQQQQERDATWGNTPSSCMYACEAFTAVAMPELAKESLQFIRDIRYIEDGQTRIDLTRLSTLDDFEQIRLRIEDMENPRPASARQVSAVEIDRFHETWVMGLCLSAEAVAGDGDTVRGLVETVEHMPLNSGAFYPESVPWVTARMLIGLGAAGQTVETSRTVRRAVDWLLRPSISGGPWKDGVWESGTGGWNSTVEATAMVLIAFASVGVDASGDRFRLALDYLRATRRAWMARGAELDGALAIRALLENGAEWDDVSADAVTLSARALEDAVWQGAVVSAAESLAQSCKTAQIATDLLKIAWSGLRSNIGALLAAVDLPN